MLNNLSFLSKATSKIKLSRLNNTLNIVHKRSNKPRAYLFFDILFCAFMYGSGHNDYRYYFFESLTHKKRKTYVTRGVNNKVVRLLNNKEYTNFLSDKTTFNKKFASYTKKSWLDLRQSTLNEFVQFVENKKYIIVKPVFGSCGKGIEKYCTQDFPDIGILYRQLIEKKQFLAEEYLVQHSQMQSLYPMSVNTIRIVTVNHNGKQNVLYAFVRIGNNGAVVDNLNSGGMTAPVNVNTGVVTHPAYDKEENTYICHPLTGTKIVGFVIPLWEQAKNMCINACKEIEQLGYVGWDVCITENDVVLIEANEYPGHDILQLPCHLNSDKLGMLPRFRELIPEL